MYIAQAFNILHDWWRYLLGIFIIIAFVLVGQIPLTIAVFAEALEKGMSVFDINEQNMMTLLEPNYLLFLMLLTFAFGLLGVFIVVKFLHKQSVISLTTSRLKIDWKRIFFAFFLWGIITTAFILIDYYLTPENFILNFKLKPFLLLCIIGIILVPIQTSFEEYLFRGYLMQGIGVMTKNRWLPLIITSVIFGLLHIANPEVEKLGYIIMVYYVGTGLFLGIITLMDKGLELALGFHAANNLFTALLVTADWTAFQTHSVFKDISDPTEHVVAQVLVPVLVFFPLLLIIFSLKYKWKNWNKILFGKIHPVTTVDKIEPMANNETY